MDNKTNPTDRNILKQRIRELLRERHAVLMAHYYTVAEVQEVADFVGDSLALAQYAAKTGAKVIVMAGVHFMAETCKILCPRSTVLCPDMEAGCSLADSCKAEDLKRFKEQNPNVRIVSYVNTTAEVKALTDVVVTSGNARRIVETFPKGEDIMFLPDYNLGSYINATTGRTMRLWQGGCHVHERFPVREILRLKKENPEALVLVHPECKAPVVALGDVVGSTAVLLKYVKERPEGTFIVATESGILHKMREASPGATFLPVAPEVSEGEGGIGNVGCSCNECEFMKLNTLEKIIASLETLQPEIQINSQTAALAKRSIDEMLRLS